VIINPDNRGKVQLVNARCLNGEDASRKIDLAMLRFDVEIVGCVTKGLFSSCARIDAFPDRKNRDGSWQLFV